MELTTANYSGTTIPEVIESLENDKDLMDFISGQNLPGGNVLKAIASTMVCDDPAIVYLVDLAEKH